MYRVRCPHCDAEYDAATAVGCDCLDLVRSVRCTACNDCWCTAREKTKKALWEKAPPAMRNRRSELSEPLPPGRVRHPLIVFADDDPTSRAIMRRVAANLNLTAVLIGNGLDLVEAARRYRPELVITDALMPGMDGREASKIIKSELPSTKVVVITSVYKNVRYRHEAMKDFGVDDYLHKPVTPEELGQTVVRHLALAD